MHQALQTAPARVQLAFHVRGESTHRLVSLVVALRVEGDEGVALMELEVLKDGVNAKLGAPLHAGRIHFLGTLQVVLSCTQEAPQEVVVCTGYTRSRTWLPYLPIATAVAAHLKLLQSA